MRLKPCFIFFVFLFLLYTNHATGQFFNTTGDNQSTEVGTLFPTALSVHIPGGFFGGYMSQNIRYIILPGPNGASATFAGGATIAHVTTEVNDNVRFTANTIAGSFKIEAKNEYDENVIARFNVTNNPGPAYTATVATGDNQSTLVSTDFPTTLTASVKDRFGNVVPGNYNIGIRVAPATNGAACTLNGSSTELLCAVNNGISAPVHATANGISGNYTVVAGVGGVSGSQALTVPGTFHLTNSCMVGPIVVTSNADSGPGSLRQAIKDACPGAVITFASSVTSITLSSDQLLINKSITLNGPGAGQLTISGNNSFRVFEIANGVNATISGMTIRDGRPATAGLGGGGIAVRDGANTPGTINITGCIITGNTASASTVNTGGGIDNEGAAMTIDRCTIINNTAGVSGGGIQNQGSGASMTLRNSTLTNNSAGTGGGVYSPKPVIITNCTIYGNSAKRGGNVSGTGINIGNTIIAGGMLLNGGTTGPDIDGLVITSDYNLVQDIQGGAFIGPVTHSITDVDPNLLPSGSYGGPYPTLLPAPNSPVINAGNTTLVSGTDQRGFPRLTGTQADIGAVETNYTLTPTAGTPQSVLINTAFALALQAKVSESGSPIRGVLVSFKAPAWGAGGTFPGPSLIATAITNAGGVAVSPVFTANSLAGTYRVKDSIGPAVAVTNHTLTNTGSCVLTCPANIIVNSDPNQCGAIVTFSQPALTGNCSTLTTSPASGSFFPKGVTTVTATSSSTGVVCTFTVTVTDSQLPVITLQPADRSTCGTGNVTFTVAATHATGYQWQVNNGSGFTNIPGATNAILSLNNVTAAMNGNRYQAVVSGTCTPVTSSAAVLTIGGPSSVSIAAIPLTQLRPGQTTILFAHYDHVPASFAWYRNNRLSAITTQGVLPNIGIDSLGIYKVLCLDNNGCSAASGELVLSAESDTKLWVYPNPSNGLFQVRSYSASAGTLRVVNVYNSKGTRVYHKQFTINNAYEKMQVDISLQPIGVYYVELADAQGKQLAMEKVLYVKR